MNRFKERLLEHGTQLRKRRIDVLQVNVGKLCNQCCFHCHVDAGPSKIKENMTRKTAKAVVRFMDMAGVQVLDITGGAPELNPNFRYLVTEGRKRDLRVIDRCNLTVFCEPEMSDLPDFLAQNMVEVVASLPCYQKENVDRQRGIGVFDRSIAALLRLNHLGYGKDNSGLILNLVYNPVAPHLPTPQDKLEADYKERLQEGFGVVFNHLFTITNMPIARYAGYLKTFGQYDSYIELLINSFNPAALDCVMCLNTLSVRWDGAVYDCDFNQMMGMGIGNGRAFTIFDVTPRDLEGWEILTADHCFGCTAGTGSSCRGRLIVPSG